VETMDNVYNRATAHRGDAPLAQPVVSQRVMGCVRSGS
jgi:hypothetical protein